MGKLMRNFLTVVVVSLLTAVVSEQAVANKEAAAREAIDIYRTAQSLGDAERRREAFTRAANAFTELGDAQTSRGAGSAEALANSGTAYLQAEQTGQAVLAFRRALLLQPRHHRSRKTLAELRAALPAWVPAPAPTPDDSFFRWHQESTQQEREITMLVAFWLAAVIGALGIAFGITWLIWSSAVPAVVFVGALTSAMATYLAEDKMQGVITEPDTVARTADSRNASSRFVEPLPEGTEVSVEEMREFWTRVRLADGTTAWVRRGAVTPL